MHRTVTTLLLTGLLVLCLPHDRVVAEGPETDMPLDEPGAPVLKQMPKHVRDGMLGGRPWPQLAIFHRRLAEFRAGKGTRLTLIQIGDSHTAGDQFTGRLRATFQAQFGNAGRGQIAPGVPAPYWRPSSVKAEQSGKWQVFTSNKSAYAKLPYGISGYVLRGAEAGDTMTLTASGEDARFASVEVGYYAQPGGGGFKIIVDGTPVETVSTSGAAYRYGRVVVAAPSAQAQQLEIRVVGDGAVDLAHWATYRETRGIEFVSHGFVGAQVGILDRWDERVVTEELAELDPALVILAFGTNEGFAPADRLRDYGERLRARIALLQRLAPHASIVLVAGPDANRYPKYCAGGSEGTESKFCRPLSPGEAAAYETLLARSDKTLCRWHTPPGYAVVRAAQREAAERMNVLWWDWMGFQGGPCAASAWEAKGLVHKDRVHLKNAGSALSADAFYAQLVRGLPQN
jgi:lysophospholipase L1-like esterase